MLDWDFINAEWDSIVSFNQDLGRLMQLSDYIVDYLCSFIILIFNQVTS